MATNIAIDDQLIERAKKVGRFRTKKETVTVALEELIQRRQQHKLLKLIGTVEFRDDWDHKEGRRDRGHRR